MISNLYTWIFPAAVFTAAGIFNLSSSVKRKRNPVRARRNKVVWFSINISIAFCFIAVSAFFVDWSEFIWSNRYLYFSFIIFILFYLIFILRYRIGFPLVFFLVLIVLFFTIYLQGWMPVTASGVLGQYRILSNDKNAIIVELSLFDTMPVFVKEEEADISLNFEIMEVDRFLFFVNSNSYYRVTKPLFEMGLADKIINYTADKTFFLSVDNYSVKLSSEAIFLQYDIVFDMDQKKIIIEN